MSSAFEPPHPPGPHPLVAAGGTRGKANNPLTQQLYATIGSNGALEARPSVLHFGGFELNKVHEQVLRIVNVSGVSQRLHIIMPGTPYLQARVDKKGAIAPGMSEDVTIQFRPTEWRYYYDCLRLHSERDNILVPIHAYPVVNEVEFPRRIDLGQCLLSRATSRTATLSCKVPIPFDFQLRVVKPHPDFVVHPMSGQIPANGSVTITFEFRPIKLCTVDFEIELSVSQFNHTPVRCRVVGSTAAGLIRDGIIKELKARRGGDGRGPVGEQPPSPSPSPPRRQQQSRGPATDDVLGDDLGGGGGGGRGGRGGRGGGVDEAQLRREALLAASSRPRREGGGGAASGAHSRFDLGSFEGYDDRVVAATHGIGAGAVKDAGAAYVGLRRRNEWQQRSNKLAAMDGTVPEGGGGRGNDLDRPTEVDMEGYRVPTQLNSVTAVSYVLTQTAGKLKPKDLKQAINKQQAEREHQRLAQEAVALEQQGGTGGSALGETRADVMAAREAAGVKVDQGDGAGGGSRQMRELVFLQEVAEVDEAEKQREFTSASYVGEEPMEDAEVGQVLDARLDALRMGEVATRQAARDRRTTSGAGLASQPSRRGRCMSLHLGTPVHTPQFDENRNDAWQMRRAILERFARAANKVILQRRVSQRLARLQQRLSSAGVTTREECRAFVDLDNRAAEAQGGGASSGASQGGGAPAHASKGGVQPTSFPEFLDEENKAPKPIDTCTRVWFEHMSPLQLATCSEAALLGYSGVELPVVPMYMSFEKARPLRKGAAEECGGEITALSLDSGAGGAGDAAGGKLAAAGAGAGAAEGDGKPGTLGGSPENLSELYARPMGWTMAPYTRFLQLLQPNASVRYFVDANRIAEDNHSHYLRPRFVMLLGDVAPLFRCWDVVLSCAVFCGEVHGALRSLI